MISRRLEQKIKHILKRTASVTLLGPRQVGKTTLSFEISKTIPALYLDLENNLDLLKAQDITIFQQANAGHLIILDEVQRLPHIFQEVRGIIDNERRKGNKTGLFIFLGSASIDLLKQSSESLAGRVSYLELFPIDVLEFSNKNNLKTNELWYRGGFPDSLLSENDTDSFNWRKDFIKTYLERDIPQLGPRIPAETLARFWTMLAHNQGSIFNASQLSRSLDVSHTTIIRYLDLMVDLLLVRRLQPYTFNIGKRLIKAPKVYVRDSGITHALLHIKNYNDLLGNPIVGNSWEGFVIENIMAVAPSHIKAYFYRTSGGAEIDLVLESETNEIWAIEIKRSTAPKPSKGFHSACDDLNPKEKFIVYSGSDTFTTKNDITIISLYDIMERLVNL